MIFKMQNNYTTIYDLLTLKFFNRFMEIEFWKEKISKFHYKQYIYKNF